MTVAVAISCAGKVRKRNEDCAAVDNNIIDAAKPAIFELDLSRHLLIVADGMGGHARGDVASALAVRYFMEQYKSIENVSSCMELIRGVNSRVYQAMQRDDDLRGMGTTIAGIVLNAGSAIWFNVGDSRVYLLRKVLRQLSTDHVPLSQDGKRAGTHSITQSIGGRFSPAEVAPAVGTIPLKTGDKLLVCTDGVTDVVSDPEIQSLISGKAPSESVSALIGLAMERGGPDNATIILTWLG